MKKKLGKNVISSFAGQLLILMLGILLPRFVLTTYGSDANGLLATITQIFTYLALLEAGIGQATKNALYKPISNGDKLEMTNIYNSSCHYFRRITIGYAVGVCVIAILSPFIFETNINNYSVMLAVAFEGLSGVISFYFTEAPTIFITVNGYGYVCNNTNTALRVLTYVCKIVLVHFGTPIFLLQLSFFVISIIKCIIINLYLKNKFGWLLNCDRDYSYKLPDRGAYVVNEVAWTMFSATDVLVLSIFLSTEVTSVYSIYNMVFSQFSILLNAVYGSISYILGQTYHKNKNEYIVLHDSLNSVFLGIMTMFLATSYILIIPFVKLYTRGVDDIEYIDNRLPILFCIVQFLSWSRYVSGNLTGIAGYAKKTSIISLIEAGINITLSVVFVQLWGIFGVLLATVVALPLKVAWCVYISDRKILKRSIVNSMLIISGNFAIIFVAFVIGKIIKLTVENYLWFVVYGVLIFLIFIVLTVAMNCLINPNLVRLIKKRRIVDK